MSITKFIALAAVAATTTVAFADAANPMIEFTSTNDKYADGEPVKDREWYALCWSSDGVFEGITKDYKPLDSNDKIILIAPVAEKGGCSVWFEPDSAKVPKGGKFCVILLDTRDGVGNPATSVSGKLLPNRAPNMAIASACYEVKTAKVGSAIGAQTVVANAGWGVTDPNPETPAKIAGIDPAAIDVNGNEVVAISVSDLYPGVRYNFKAGSEPDKVVSYALNTPVSTNVTSAVIILPKDDAKFFRLVQEPMVKPVVE